MQRNGSARTIAKRLAVALLLLFFVQKSAIAQDAQEYLNNALNQIESCTINRDKISWNDVCRRAQSMAINASKPSDTYPAITYALSQLNDNHSFMMTPDKRPVAFPPGTKRMADNRPQRATQRQDTGGFLQSRKGRIGHVVIGAISGDEMQLKDYCKKLRAQVARCRTYGVKGWVIDLRGNSGGNMWPMLVGIGPVLGAGTIGYFNFRNHFMPWYYRQGAAGVIGPGGANANFSIVDGLSDYHEQAPIAVLIDRNTLSSGEAVAIAFKNRANTRFFGERTGGLSTANKTITLSDGATIMVTSSYEADRNKTVYPSFVEPDMTIEQGKIPCGAPSDPVIAAALQWIDSAY